MAAFNISDRDIDALARIAYAEAGQIARQTGDLKAAYGSVVDTVLNRASADQPYMGGSSVQGVINHTNDPRYYQFTPIAGARGRTWEGLRKPPAEVYEAVKAHLSDLQQGQGSVIGKATHYLNPSAPGTDVARRGWARNWANWPEVGNAPISHRFGNPDGVTVPDYSVSYEPRLPPAPSGLGGGATVAESYAKAGLGRSLAPTLPVDRTFNTPQVAYRRMAQTGGAAGIRGVGGGAPDVFAAPVGPVARAPLPPPVLGYTAPPGTAASPFDAILTGSVQRKALPPIPGQKVAIPRGMAEAYAQMGQGLGAAGVGGLDGRLAPPMSAPPMQYAPDTTPPRVEPPGRAAAVAPRASPAVGKLDAMAAAGPENYRTMALPGGMTARTSGRYGWTEIGGPDGGSHHAGKVVAVDPQGKSYRLVTPQEATELAGKGWKTSLTPDFNAPGAKPGAEGGLIGLLKGDGNGLHIGREGGLIQKFDTLFGKPKTPIGKAVSGVKSASKLGSSAKGIGGGFLGGLLGGLF